MWLQLLASHIVSWPHKQHSILLVGGRSPVSHLQVHMLWACSLWRVHEAWAAAAAAQVSRIQGHGV